MKITRKALEESLKGMSPENALEYLLSVDMGDFNAAPLFEKLNKRISAEKKEKDRFLKLCEFEKEGYSSGCSYIAGVDEAGRGPLAGSVVAAAVILPKDVFIEGLDDSKKLSPEKRGRLFDEIREKALSFGIGIVDEKEIDEINIKNAAIKAMGIAVRALDIKPDLVLVDAEQIKSLEIPQRAIIKGDALSISIAAASVIAKVTRDRMIDALDEIYPQYGFIKHKGYGTKEHIDAIKKYGLCPIHRISFTKNFVDRDI